MSSPVRRVYELINRSPIPNGSRGPQMVPLPDGFGRLVKRLGSPNQSIISFLGNRMREQPKKVMEKRTAKASYEEQKAK